MPILLVFFNKGYKTANIYLAGVFFFTSLHIIATIFFFYGESINLVAFLTCMQPFIYLIGPFALFYVRDSLRDNKIFHKSDLLHFILFTICIFGVFPYWFSSWDNKLEVARKLTNTNWNVAEYKINNIIPYKLDQILGPLMMIFYTIAQWVILISYNKESETGIRNMIQIKQIKKWLYLYVSMFSLLVINFSILIAMMWFFDKKSIFVQKAEYFIMSSTVIYITINLSLLCFPRILYRLSFDQNATNAFVSKISTSYNQGHVFLDTKKNNLQVDVNKIQLQLFSEEYINDIEKKIAECIKLKKYLNPEFSLANYSKEYNIPSHHITYYFNHIKKITFIEWRNKLRIKHSIELMKEGANQIYTLNAISIQCGFSSQNTFIRVFKTITGDTPSEYLQKIV